MLYLPQGIHAFIRTVAVRASVARLRLATSCMTSVNLLQGLVSALMHLRSPDWTPVLEDRGSAEGSGSGRERGGDVAIAFCGKVDPACG